MVDKTNVPEPKVETKDLYNIEVIRDYYGQIDPFYLTKKDPEFEYRFLRADDKNLSIKTGNLLFQKGGWQLCSKEHLLKLGIQERFISPDGLYRVGDTVLARMPKKLFEEKEKQKVESAKTPMASVRRMVKDGDPSKGGKEIHETMKGIQTKKQLGM